MPSIVCKCGEQIRYGNIPCVDEWLFISDVDFDQFSNLVDSEDIYKSMKHALKCPSCQRLWLYTKGFDCQPAEYVFNPPRTAGQS
jgi:hypothetical protein